jgi:HK97 family phage prohead protease
MYDDIGSGFWSDGITAKSVKSEIDSNPNAKSIRISLNSPGGDAIEGCAIHSVLRDWANSQPDRSVNVKVDGIAASAASVIAMAGDTVTMGIGSMMMVHQAWSRCTGYADDMRKNADVLDCISQSIAQVYSSKTGMAAESCLALMADETWMTAGDCVDKGFADDIAEETPDELETEDQAMAMARGFKLLASMKKVPEQLRPQVGGLASSITNAHLRSIADGIRAGTAAFHAAAIPSHSTATVDSAWDGPANEARLKSDQSYAYYSKAFAWVDDGGDKSKKGSYRFPHHEVSADGTPGAANVKACQSGIAVLNGGRGGTTIPDADKKGVYNHLAAHLKSAGLTPPAYKGTVVEPAVDPVAHVDPVPAPIAILPTLYALIRSGAAGAEYELKPGQHQSVQAQTISGVGAQDLEPVQVQAPILAVRRVGNAKLCLPKYRKMASGGTVGAKPVVTFSPQAGPDTFPDPITSASGVLAPYNIPSVNLGDFVEVYQKGCFSAWLTTFSDYRVLFNHDSSMVLGRRSAGTAYMWDTDAGLCYSADFPSTSYARDLAVLLDRGDINEASTAMWILAYRWETRNGVKTRVVEKAALLEGSIESFAAYTATSAEIDRPAEELQEQERIAAQVLATAQAIVDPPVVPSVAAQYDDFDLDVRIRMLGLTLATSSLQ